MERRTAAAACSAAALLSGTLSSKTFRITRDTPGWNDRAAGRQTRKGIGSASILLAPNALHMRTALTSSVSRFRAAAPQTLDHFRRFKNLRATASARLLPLELYAVPRLQIHAP